MFYKSLIISNISTFYVIGWTWYNRSQKYIKMESVKQLPFLRKFQIPGILLKSKKRFPHLYFVVAKGLVCDYDTIYARFTFSLCFNSVVLFYRINSAVIVCVFLKILSSLEILIIYPAPLFYKWEKSDPQRLIAFCKIWY